MAQGTFRVPHRVYSEPDRFGYRRLLYAAGRAIGHAEAVEAGLVGDGPLPPGQVPFTVPRDVFTEAPEGRTLAARSGSTITLERAMELGLVESPSSPDPDPATEPVPGEAEPEQPKPGRQVRTTKAPAPEG